MLWNLHELYVAFREQNSDVKVYFSKCCSLCPKSCVIAGKSGIHSVCVCTIHQNAVLLVNAVDWDVACKFWIGKIACDSTNRKYMIHRCENCLGKEALRTFLNKEITDFDADEEFHYIQWKTTDWATLQAITVTCSKYIEKIVEGISTLTTPTKRSFLPKCRTNFIKTKTESLTKWINCSWWFYRKWSVYYWRWNSKLPLEKRILHPPSCCLLFRWWWQPCTQIILFSNDNHHDVC